MRRMQCNLLASLIFQPAAKKELDMFNPMLVQGLVRQALNDPYLYPGQMFRGSPAPLPRQAQAIRDESVVEAHKRLDDTTLQPKDLRCYQQRTFLEARDMFAIGFNKTDFATCFENAEQAKGFARSLCELDVDNLELDPLYPLSAEQKRVTVAVLVQACMSIANAQDSPDRKDQFGRKVCDLRMVEIRCWTMLKTGIVRTINSQPLIRPLGSSHTTLAFADVLLGDRVDGLVAALSRSKYRTNEVLNPSPILQLLDNPGHVIQRTLINKDMAKLKQQDIERGKAAALAQSIAALGEGDVGEIESEADVIEEDSPTNSVVPRKRPRFDRNIDRNRLRVNVPTRQQGRQNERSTYLEANTSLPEAAYTTSELLRSLPAPQPILNTATPSAQAYIHNPQLMPLPPLQPQQNSQQHLQAFGNTHHGRQAQFAAAPELPVLSSDQYQTSSYITPSNWQSEQQQLNTRPFPRFPSMLPTSYWQDATRPDNSRPATQFAMGTIDNTRTQHTQSSNRPGTLGQPLNVPESPNVVPSVEIPPSTAAVPDAASHLTITMHDGTYMHVPINTVDSRGYGSSAESDSHARLAERRTRNNALSAEAQPFVPQNGRG